MATPFELQAGKPVASALRSAFVAGTGKAFWDGLSRSLSFALSIVVARRLGAEGYGTFAVHWYFAWMLAQATDLGLHLVSLRSLARGERKGVFWSAVALKTLLTVASLAALLFAVVTGLTTAAWLVLLLLATQTLGSWVEFLGVAARSRGLVAREGIVLTTLRLGWLGAALWSLAQGTDLGALALLLALSGIPAALLAMALLPRSAREGAPSLTETSCLVKEALPLAAGSAITLVYLRADLWIVAALQGAAEAGLFQGAFRLFEATFVLSGGIAAGTFPLLASRLGKPGFQALSRFVLVLLSALAVPLACAFAFAGETVIVVLLGEGFREAARALPFLGIALLAVFVNALTTHLLVAAGRGRRFVEALAVRLGVGVGLDFLLVPTFGATGAAMAVAAAEWSLLVVSVASVADLLGFTGATPRDVARGEVSPCS